MVTLPNAILNKYANISIAEEACLLYNNKLFLSPLFSILQRVFQL